MKSMAKSEEYRLQDETRRKEEYEAQKEIRKEEVKLRLQELDGLCKETKTLKIGLDAKLAAQRMQSNTTQSKGMLAEESMKKSVLKWRTRTDEKRKREQQEQKRRDIVQQIPLTDEKTDVESYLEVFEVSMKCNPRINGSQF